ncbi:MAG: hypothetical protein H7249_07365 [Chitinophagaceae bacterium]|nr:hypothetical protein [Oligoflexus sp.]
MVYRLTTRSSIGISLMLSVSSCKGHEGAAIHKNIKAGTLDSASAAPEGDHQTVTGSGQTPDSSLPFSQATLPAAGQASSIASISSSPSASSSSSTALTVAPNPPGPVMVGRFLKDDMGYHFNWAGSRIIAKVKGVKSVTIGLTSPNIGSQKINFNVYIDHKLQTKFITLLSNVSNNVTELPDTEEHQIDWVKRTEAGYANEPVTFVGITIPNGGQILSVPALPPRRIEMIGASMTNGYGTRSDQLGIPETTSCPNDGSAEDSDLSFGAVAAHMLDAQSTIIAFQGHGILRNYPTASDPSGTAAPTVGAMWPLVLATKGNSVKGLPVYDYKDWVPDAVVINVGTNDFAPRYGQSAASGIPDETAFVNAYVTLLKNIRAKLPNALIVATFGTMITDAGSVPNQRTKGISFVNKAIAAVNDPKVLPMVDFGVQAGTGQACSYHPSAATHKKMAQQLAKVLSDKLAWKIVNP